MTPLLLPLASALTYFQAIVLGILQGVTELFPISSLGHTVLFPTLFGWNGLVDAQSEPESFWLALVVMLHVGSALGLLVYYWREWKRIIRAFLHTLATRRVQSPDRAPGVADHRREHPSGPARTGLRAPAADADGEAGGGRRLPTVNGALLAAEGFRRRAEVRELAIREGAKPDGGGNWTRSSIARRSSSGWRSPRR